MRVLVTTVLLLIASNVFMTFGQVPANRIGHTQFTVGQLKVMQEVITLSVFVPFAALYMKEPVRWNYLWAGLCLCGAAYFIFKD